MKHGSRQAVFVHNTSSQSQELSLFPRCLLKISSFFLLIFCVVAVRAGQAGASPQNQGANPDSPPDTPHRANFSAKYGEVTPRESSNAHTYQKGVALLFRSAVAPYSYENDLKEIKELGADHISLTVNWFQKNVSSNTLYPGKQLGGELETTPDEKVIEVIHQAHRLGLKVFLFPIIRLEERKDREWRGVIAPTDLDVWLKSYEDFILHYAKIAAKNNVDLFSVGSELCSMEEKTAYWIRLIAKVRKVYRGQLLYSANWDHYKKISFWKPLDFLGINAYYELAQNNTPSLDELLLKWWDIQNDLYTWQDQQKKQIIFTEIGYPSMDGTCRAPWNYTTNAPVDLQEQALCYESFFITWARNQRLGGVYFWNWYGNGGESDTNYTPRGKPAAEVLSRWFKGTPTTPSTSSSYLSPPLSPQGQSSEKPAAAAPQVQIIPAPPLPPS